MAKAYCCDLCGGLYLPSTEKRAFRLMETVKSEDIRPAFEKGVDICPVCYEEFLDFVYSKRNREPKETEETEETEETKGGLL